jgi:hypothetical protein
LWRRLMGTTVLDARTASYPELHVYAHCARDLPGAITLLIINKDRKKPSELVLPVAAERYTLASDNLADGSVRLNRKTLALDTSDQLPSLAGEATAAGPTTFAPATITFLTAASAENPNCP